VKLKFVPQTMSIFTNTGEVVSLVCSKMPKSSKEMNESSRTGQTSYYSRLNFVI